MQDPTKKWTQQKLMEMSANSDGENFSRSLDFVDAMMRLKDQVYLAGSLQRTLHHYAVTKEPIDYNTYEYIGEERSRFWHTCSGVTMACLIDYPKAVDNLKLTKRKTGKLYALIKAAGKYVDQVRRDPQNDRDTKKIIHAYHKERNKL